MSVEIDVAVIVVILCSAGLIFVRLVRGPSVPDRIVAGSAIGILFFSLLVMLTAISGSGVFFDVALVYAILQFVDMLVMARYLARKEN